MVTAQQTSKLSTCLQKQAPPGTAGRKWLRLVGLAITEFVLVALALLFFSRVQAAHALPGSLEAAPAAAAAPLEPAPGPLPAANQAPLAIPAQQGTTTTLAVAILSSPWATLDSNPKPDEEVPQVLVVEAVVTNTGSLAASEVAIALNYNDDPSHNWVLVSGEYPTRTIDSLAPNAAQHVYWFARYSNTRGASHVYTVTASAANASPVATSDNAYGNPEPGKTVKTRAVVSTGNSGVSQVSAQVVVGVAFTVTVTYDLGQNPQSASFSPVGNADFNPGDYRLLDSQVRFYNDGGTFSQTVSNRLYFPTLNSQANNAQATYTFIALTPSNTRLCPYTAIGYATNDKYDQFYCSTNLGTSIPVIGTVALSMTKQASSLTVQQGEILTYTLQYTNNGDQSLVYAWIWDEVNPSYATIVPASISPAADPNETTGQRVAWFLDNIPAAGQPGSTGTLTFTVLVNGNGVDLVDGTPIVNPAFFGINAGSLPQRKALTSTFTTTVQAPVISVSKTDGQATTEPGNALTYHLTITNSGSMTATGLVITDVLPASTGLDGAAAPPATSQAGQTLVWNDQGPILPGGGTVVITLPATVDIKTADGTILTDTMTVAYQNMAGWAYTRQTATDTTRVSAPILSISKRDAPDPVLTGRSITYTLTYTNSGPATATNVVITDAVPASTTYQNCSPSLACSFSNGVVSWNLGTVPPGSGSVSFVVQVSDTLDTGTLIHNEDYGISADQTNFIPGAPVTTEVNRDAAIIEGYTFIDTNGDGLRNGGEGGLSGVTVSLAGVTEPLTSTTTDVSGYYRFRIETAEAISVTAALPANHFRTTPGTAYLATTLGATQTVNFGYAPTTAGFGVLYGTIFADSDHDGGQDVGESGLPGVTVTSAGAVTPTVTTDPYGRYSLRYETFGQVTVSETNPPFYVSTTPDTVQATAAANSEGSSPVDFGDFMGLKITGQVFDDANVNGIKDGGESGVTGAAVTADGSIFSPTGSSGVYTLYVGLVNGDPITVVETDPAGYYSTNAVPGAGMSRTNANTLVIDAPVSGNTYTGDFGDAAAGNIITITGQVWNDNGAGSLLANGTPDSGEPGLSGAIISLSSGLTQTTGPDGAYLLYAPANQVITVTETNPAGYISTNAIPGNDAAKFDNDTLVVDALAGGSTSAGNRFGDVAIASAAVITGTVFNDANENGVRDGGETGLAGVDVTLEIDGGLSIVAPTDAGGHYQFAVAPGTNIRLTSARPGGYYPTTPESVLARPPAAGVYPNNNFGYSNDPNVAVIFGLVFDDKDSNGLPDFGELGLAGAVISLTNGATPVGTMTTSGNGLISGTFTFAVTQDETVYTLAEQNPAGYRSTSPDKLNVAVNFATSHSYYTDFGDTNNPDLASVYGTAFDDFNGNGVQDTDEPGLAGVVISVTVGGGSGVLTTTTKPYGQFSYGLIVEEKGFYTVSENDPALPLYHSTTPDAVNIEVVLNHSYVVNFGDTTETFATIMGTVFNDSSGDGVQDPAELGLQGVTVSLSSGQTTTTNEHGQYTFPVANAGFVRVTENDPAGYRSTTPNAVTVNVVSPLQGQVYRVNFGDRLNSTAGSSFFGTVFEDQNANGQWDLTEPGLSGVTVSITTIDGTPVPSVVTTNEWGQYTFLIETEGTYTITQTDLPGYHSTAAIPGNPAVTALDSNTFRADFTISPGIDLGNNLFGDVQGSQTIAISGYVWEDDGAGGGVGGDGLPNGAEAGLAGAIISLSSGLTQTTGPDGAYLLYAPANQVITITETNPAGYTSTGAVPGDSATRFSNDSLVVSALSGGSTSANNLFGDALSSTVTVSKSAEDVNGSPLLVGDIIRYTLQVTNTGTYTAFNVTVTDDLPAGVSYVDSTPDLGTTSGTDPVVWTIPALPVNTSATLHISVTIQPEAAGQTITNTATVTGGNIPNPPPPPAEVCPDGSQPSGGTCPTPTPTTSLTVGKRALDVNGPPVVVNDLIRYTLQVTNTGSYTAFDVTVTDDLPDAVNYIAATPDLGTTSGTDPVVWTIPALPADTVATLHISVTVKPTAVGQTITNSMTVTATNVPNPPPPPAEVCPDGSQPAGGTCPDSALPVPFTTLSFDKSAADVNGPPVSTGDQVVYTLQVTNSNTYTAFNVTVVDTWPLSMTLDSSSATAGTIVNSASLVTWTIDSLAQDASASLSLTGTLGTDTAGQLIFNTGTVTGSNIIANPAKDNVVLFVGVCSPDAYEPDNSAGEAQAIDFTGYGNQTLTQDHNFHLVSDQDWLQLTVRAGARYEFTTSNLGLMADTRLTLYAADGTTVLAENDDGATNVQSSRIAWNAPLSPTVQTVYLVVSQTSYVAQACGTGYTLALTQTLSGGNLSSSTKAIEPEEANLALNDPVTYTITLANSDPLLAATPVTVTDTLPLTISLKKVEICGTSGQFEQFQLITTTTAFTWVGGLGSGGQVKLCVHGTVAATPWAATNTAWISWNNQTISRSVEGKLSLPAGDVFLPIVIKNR